MYESLLFFNLNHETSFERMEKLHLLDEWFFFTYFFLKMKKQLVSKLLMLYWTSPFLTKNMRKEHYITVYRSSLL